jgi:hypothetical protein
MKTTSDTVTTGRHRKHRGRNDPVTPPYDDDDEEARGLLLMDTSDHNSHSSKERKIQASSTLTNNIKALFIATILLMAGLVFLLQGSSSA